MSNHNFLAQHYTRHEQHFENDLVDPERIRISESWFDETTADYWRHARAYECAELLRGDASASLLTVRVRAGGHFSLACVPRTGVHD